MRIQLQLLWCISAVAIDLDMLRPYAANGNRQWQFQVGRRGGNRGACRCRGVADAQVVGLGIAHDQVFAQQPQQPPIGAQVIGLHAQPAARPVEVVDAAAAIERAFDAFELGLGLVTAQIVEQAGQRAVLFRPNQKADQCDHSQTQQHAAQPQQHFQRCAQGAAFFLGDCAAVGLRRIRGRRIRGRRGL